MAIEAGGARVPGRHGKLRVGSARVAQNTKTEPRRVAHMMCHPSGAFFSFVGARSRRSTHGRRGGLQSFALTALSMGIGAGCNRRLLLLPAAPQDAIELHEALI